MNQNAEKPFSFTEADVAAARRRSLEEVGGWKALSADGRFKRNAEHSLPIWEKRAEFLEKTSPGAVVSLFEDVNSRIRVLRSSGIDDGKIGEQILDEFPDITNVVDFSELDALFGPPTGVNLGQRLSAVISNKS